MKAQAFDEKTVALAQETEAHSDDELDQPDNQSREQVYHITVKEGRSNKVKVFFRMLDQQRQRANKRKKRYQRLTVTVYFFSHLLNNFLFSE
jgi:rubrerythrin